MCVFVVGYYTIVLQAPFISSQKQVTTDNNYVSLISHLASSAQTVPQLNCRRVVKEKIGWREYISEKEKQTQTSDD